MRDIRRFRSFRAFFQIFQEEDCASPASPTESRVTSRLIRRANNKRGRTKSAQSPSLFSAVANNRAFTFGAKRARSERPCRVDNRT